LSKRLDELLKIEGRKPQEVRRSLMTGCVFGRDRSEVEDKVSARTQGKRSAADLRQRGLLVGTADEMAGQLAKLERAGVQRVMLQWLDLDDIDGLQAMAKRLIE
jgi:alkanesulfonate monooxygenase SsuD/methylene tetrahydromethanopterin reductase-like flavin-dependent oxidoreductase (luciferase family)